MSKPYGISGTPWHVEKIHNNDPDDPKRHRSRCVYYDSKTKACSKHTDGCYGAAHCSYYREKKPDLVVDKVFEEEKPVSAEKPKPVWQPALKLPGKTSAPERKSVQKKEISGKELVSRARVGSVICIGTSEYFVWDIKHDEDMNFIYVCRQIVDEDITDSRNVGLFWLYGRRCLVPEFREIEPVQVRAVKTLPPEIVKCVLDEKNRAAARKKDEKTVRAPVQAEPRRPDKYVIVPNETGKKPAGIVTRHIEIVVMKDRQRKRLPAFLDNQTRKIYLQSAAYEKYKEVLFGPDGFEIRLR